MLGKAGRSHYYSAYEEYSETMRAAIQDQVETVARRIGSAIAAPSFDSDEDEDE